jgi:hypothetical protein
MRKDLSGRCSRGDFPKFPARQLVRISRLLKKDSEPFCLSVSISGCTTPLSVASGEPQCGKQDLTLSLYNDGRLAAIYVPGIQNLDFVYDSANRINQVVLIHA